jgi:tRNA(His) guanylyltransferase
MTNDDFETRMRKFEYFHSLRLLSDTWVVIRVDGRSFSRFTESRFDKPFDARFRDAMIKASQALVKELQGIYAYTESDEISVLFRPTWDLFDRELEKVISISASVASSAFTLAIGEAVQFDSRVWVGVNRSFVVDYFRWRQADATRCALNGWCYWILRKAGKSVAEATSLLENKSVEFKNELLFQYGINFNNLPIWQRRGIGVYWETYEKEGFNPVKNVRVMTSRRRLKVDMELPMKEEYGRFIKRLTREK